MASKPTPRRRNVRQSDFRIVARGVVRRQPDASALMRATLEHYLATKDKDQAPAEGREVSDGAA